MRTLPMSRPAEVSSGGVEDEEREGEVRTSRTTFKML